MSDAHSQLFIYRCRPSDLQGRYISHTLKPLSRFPRLPSSPSSPMNDLPYSVPERKTCMPCRSVLSLSIYRYTQISPSPPQIVNEKLCVIISEIHPHHPQNLPIHQKCDGRPPKCGPCSTAKRELDCVFPSRPENRDKRNALPKGKACLSCRFVAQILSMSFPRGPSS